MLRATRRWPAPVSSCVESRNPAGSRVGSWLSEDRGLYKHETYHPTPLTTLPELVRRSRSPEPDSGLSWLRPTASAGLLQPHRAEAAVTQDKNAACEQVRACRQRSVRDSHLLGGAALRGASQFADWRQAGKHGDDCFRGRAPAPRGSAITLGSKPGTAVRDHASRLLLVSPWERLRAVESTSVWIAGSSRRITKRARS
jgi:hypothetical protein